MERCLILRQMIRESTIWWAYAVIGVCTGCDSGDASQELARHSRALTVDQGQGEAVDRVGLEAARDRVRQYFVDQRARMGVVATTMTSDGTIFDWTVSTEDELRSPVFDGNGAPTGAFRSTEEDAGVDPVGPLPLPPLPKGAVYAKSIFETEPDAQGPKGTTGHVRPNIEDLLRAWGDKVPDDPERLFDVIPAPNPDGNGRYHAEVMTDSFGLGYTTPPLQLIGMEGRITIWSAAMSATPFDTSIMQINLCAGDRTAGTTNTDSLEAGKIQITNLNGDQPTFFVFSTSSNYRIPAGPGYCPGGYVQNPDYTVYGWHQHGLPNPWVPAMPLTPSTIGNVQVLFLQWWRIDTGYFLYANGNNVGYYEQHCTVAGNQLQMWHPSDGTAAAGLRDYGQYAELYGEVHSVAATCNGVTCAAATCGATPCTGATTTDMGNGLTSDDPNSAWIDSMKVRKVGADPINGTNVYYTALPGQFQNKYRTDPACYGRSPITPTVGFYLGGPGKVNGGSCN